MEVKKFRIMHDSPLSDKPVCIALAVVHTWGAFLTWTGGIEGCSIYFVPFDLTLMKSNQMVEVEEFTRHEQMDVDAAIYNAERYLTEYRKVQNAEKTILPE